MSGIYGKKVILIFGIFSRCNHKCFYIDSSVGGRGDGKDEDVVIARRYRLQEIEIHHRIFVPSSHIYWESLSPSK